MNVQSLRGPRHFIVRVRRFLPLAVALGLPFAAGNAMADGAWVAGQNASASVTGPGQVTMNFPITRVGDLSYDVWLTYATRDGTAKAGVDYIGSSGRIKIPAAATSVQLPVSILGSSTNDPDKTFTLNLGGVSGGLAPSFTAPQTFAVGPTPVSVTTADLNGDGKPDLIVANFYANNVSVLVNTTPHGGTSPTFTVQQTYGVGPNPVSVAAQDLNGDGKPDLIVVNSGGSGSVSVLMNQVTPGETTLTSASFAAQQTFAAGGGPASITMADVNSDGKPDLIVANQHDDTVSVLLNQITSDATTLNATSFAAQQTFDVGADPVSVTTADVNGDGKPDLIVANQRDDTVSVLLNQVTTGAIALGATSFAAQQTFAAGTLPQSVATVDVNGDGKPDLIVANQLDDTVSVLLNHVTTGAITLGTTSFAAQQTFAVGTHPQSVATADVNGDGQPDLLIATGDAAGVSVLLNQVAPGATVLSTTSFAAQQTFAAGTGADSITTADVNGDGFPDVMVANRGAATVSVLLSTQNSTSLLTSSLIGTIHYAVQVPVVNLSSVVLNFGSLAPGATGTTQTLTLTNAGNADLRGLTFSFTGADPGDFSQTNTCPATLPDTAGSNSCTIDLRFEPAANGARTASLSIVSNAASSPDTVTLSGTGDAPPVASSQNLTLYSSHAGSGQLSAVASNGHALTYAAVTQPTHGTLALTASSGVFTYTPAAGYTGSDSFTFNANDGTAISNTATVSLTVNAVPVQYAAPVASNANLTTYAAQTLGGQLSAVASNGHALAYEAVTQPAHGKLTIAVSTGAFTYAPASGYIGSDSFTFDASDGTTISNTATVSLSVNAVPVQYAAPVVSNVSLTTYAGQPLSGQLSAVASNGHALTYAALTQPAHGALALTASSGAFTYTPAADYTGSDSFTFSANDGSSISNTATVSITVGAAPTASVPPRSSGGGGFGLFGLLLLTPLLRLRKRCT